MFWWLIYFVVFDVSFALAILLTPVFRRLSFNWGHVDQPSEDRKIHGLAIPLLGGLAVFLAFAVNILLGYLVALPLAARFDFPLIGSAVQQAYVQGAYTVFPKLAVLLVGGALMVGVGLYDDKHSIRARTKLIAQIIVAAAVSAGGNAPDIVRR